MRQSELAEKREEEQHDLWFNRIRLMTKVKQTWREKRPRMRMATVATSAVGRRLGSPRIREKAPRIRVAAAWIWVATRIRVKIIRRSAQPRWRSTWCSPYQQNFVHQ
jgi:hypothetical protein